MARQVASRRGFASMDKEKQREIASKGVEGFGSAIRSSAGAVGKTRAMATELALRRCKLSSARTSILAGHRLELLHHPSMDQIEEG